MQDNLGNSVALPIREILNKLPHRFPMLLIDRIVEITPDTSITALKNVTINEPFFQGHYPHFPVMPGVLIIESMAQAAAVLALGPSGNSLPHRDEVYYFVGIENARFRRPVIPGDQLIIDVRLRGAKRGIWKFDAIARVSGEACADAAITCAVRPTPS